MLPSIENHIEIRTGIKNPKDKQHIPDRNDLEFWKNFYETIKDYTLFDEPISQMRDKINPYFGFFGFRFHPNRKIPGYFHTGISINTKPKEVVLPICDGVLEYSGFDIVNGFYVFLSHPHIQTEDGFVMHSLYMHLKKPLVKFSSYQKMLREISFRNYPKIFIERGTPIGEAGSTGVPDGKHHHLHLQIEFRHPQKKTVILIDPLRLYESRSLRNISADFKSVEDFIDVYKFRKKELKKWGIERYFE